MSRKIEVFVRSETAPTIADYSSFASDHAACRGTIYKEESYVKYKMKKTLSEDSRKMLDEAKQKATELDAPLVVHDLATWKGKLIARLKGVNAPTWRLVE
jgi:hypothetical protein